MRAPRRPTFASNRDGSAHHTVVAASVARRLLRCYLGAARRHCSSVRSSSTTRHACRRLSTSCAFPQALIVMQLMRALEERGDSKPGVLRADSPAAVLPRPIRIPPWRLPCRRGPRTAQPGSPLFERDDRGPGRRRVCRTARGTHEPVGAHGVAHPATSDRRLRVTVRNRGRTLPTATSPYFKVDPSFRRGTALAPPPARA